MKTIDTRDTHDDNSFGNFLDSVPKEAEIKAIAGRNASRKFFKNAVNYGGLFIGVFLLFVVVVTLTTNIKLNTIATWADLGVQFFVLLFCVYAIFVVCSDSGTKAGLQSDSYDKSIKEYDEQKAKITSNQLHLRMREFCQYYVKQESIGMRARILADVGIGYKEFSNKWMHLSKSEVKGIKELSKAQRKAIIHAISVKPIRITPEMILKRGRGSLKRSPLGVNPETKKKMTFLTRFLRVFAVSMLMSIIAFDVLIQPTWVTFVSVALRTMTAAISGFNGYKFGLENIIFDTCHYIDDQTDLMKQFLVYVESHPIEVDVNDIEQVNDYVA